MKKLWTLSRMYMRGLFKTRAKSRFRGRLGKAALGALVALVYGIIALYIVLLGVGLNAIGLISVYPTMVLALSSIISLTTTVSKAPSTLFRSSDLDMILSMPIRTEVVATARILELYGINLAFALGAMIPAGGVYVFFQQPGIAFYFIYVAAMLLAPLIPLLIASVLGALLHIVSSSFRNSRMVSLALTFLFMLAMFSGSFMISYFSDSLSIAQLMNISRMVSSVFERIYPPAKLFAEGVVGLDIGAFALYAGASLAALAAMIFIFGRYFVPINTMLSARRTRGNYRHTRQRQRSARTALLMRELKLYFSSNIYVLNTAFGIVMSTLGVCALFFYSPAMILAVLELTGYEALFHMGAPFVVALLMCTVCTTGSSISMEGKRMWIAKALPVSAKDYLMGKLRMNLWVVMPFLLINAGLLSIALRLPPLGIALSVLLPSALALFTALCGLMCNLKWHKFDWVSEAAVVKQSIAPMLPLLFGALVSLGGIALMAYVPMFGYAIVPVATTVVMFCVDLVLYAMIRKNAEKWVAAL